MNNLNLPYPHLLLKILCIHEKICDRLQVRSDLTWVINDMLGSRVKQVTQLHNISDFTQCFFSPGINVLTSNLPWNELWTPSERPSLIWIHSTGSAACVPHHSTHIYSLNWTHYFHFVCFSPFKPICIWLEIQWKWVKSSLDWKSHHSPIKFSHF